MIIDRICTSKKKVLDWARPAWAWPKAWLGLLASTCKIFMGQDWPGLECPESRPNLVNGQRLAGSGRTKPGRPVMQL